MAWVVIGWFSGVIWRIGVAFVYENLILEIVASLIVIGSR